MVIARNLLHVASRPAMAEPSVTYRVADGVGTIALNRPHVLNALDVPVEALADAAEAAAARPRGLGRRGAGRGPGFCSGMDRKALSAGAIGEPFYRHWTRGLNCSRTWTS